MKYLLYGDDPLVLQRRKKEIIALFLRQNTGGTLHTFSQEELGKNQEHVAEELSAGLFDTPKLLVIEGMSALMESKKEYVQEVLTSNTSATIIFVENEKLTKSNSFLKYAEKHIQHTESYDAKKRDLSLLLEATQAELGPARLDQKTLALIRERTGKDDELFLQNVRKILTYGKGEVIAPKDFDALLAAPLEAKIFDALDALVAGQRDRAMGLFQIILNEEDIFRIFPLCAWQIRQMLLISEAKELSGESKDTIAKATAIHPFVVQKLLRVLPHFPRPRLARGLKLLADMDVDLKQGKRTPEGALQYFLFHW